MIAIYGTSYIEAARQLLVSRLNELVSAMSNGYDPALMAVYDGHTIPALALNSVSVGLDRAIEVEGASAVGLMVDHKMSFSLRIHTDYVGGLHDEIVQARLLESVENKLRAKIKLSSSGSSISDMRIWTIGPSSTRQEFGESASIGGVLYVEVRAVVDHVQE